MTNIFQSMVFLCICNQNAFDIIHLFLSFLWHEKNFFFSIFNIAHLNFAKLCIQLDLGTKFVQLTNYQCCFKNHINDFFIEPITIF